MSIRQTIIDCLAKRVDMATVQDISSDTGLPGGKKMSDNLKSMITDGLVRRTRDDVTFELAYVLTPEGLARARKQDPDEARVDVIGQNGNDGEHYTSDEAPPAPSPALLASANRVLHSKIEMLEAALDHWQRTLRGVTGCDTPEDAAAFLVEARNQAEQAERIKPVRQAIAYAHANEHGIDLFDTEEAAKLDIEKSLFDGHAAKSYLVAVLATAQAEVKWVSA